MLTTQAQRDVLDILFPRYLKLIEKHGSSLEDLPPKCDGDHLYMLCTDAMVNMDLYPFDKMCRWLGFIQGVLAVQGIIDVDVERDYTRPLFHGLSETAVPSFG